ncbi:MAG: hypothetical protein LUC18_00285 [Porphyromonadaceae bacterium]|nr:hypothetical protein [Porphyromonadaceae bacterium]
MKRVRLTRDEKTVLRYISGGATTCPCGYPEDKFYNAVVTLCLKHQFLWVEFSPDDEKLTNIRMAQLGKSYLARNPHLRNPIDRTAVIALAALAIGIADLFLITFTN